MIIKIMQKNKHAENKDDTNNDDIVGGSDC